MKITYSKREKRNIRALPVFRRRCLGECWPLACSYQPLPCHHAGHLPLSDAGIWGASTLVEALFLYCIDACCVCIKHVCMQALHAH